MAKVEDPRLDELAKIFRPKKIIPAEITYFDIPISDPTATDQLTVSGQYLNQLQLADAFVQVIRAFEDPRIPHPEGGVNPNRDIEIIRGELVLSDLLILEKRSDKVKESLKSSKGAERDRIMKEQVFLEKLKQGLEDKVPYLEESLSSEETRFIANYNLLATKPMITVVNVDDSQLENAIEINLTKKHIQELTGQSGVVFNAKLEADLMQLSQTEQQEFRESLGLPYSCLHQLTKATLDIMDMCTFLTVGSDEVRAWLITNNQSAVSAARKIHSDIERGFIRAEVIGYDDFMSHRSMTAAKKQGLVRSEGKSYPVKDGDIINYLFNV
jgi:GTP-binding protein YchF